MDEKPAEIFVCTACGWQTDDDSLLDDHLHDEHRSIADGWQCGNCKGLFDFEQDARECCRDGYPAS